MPGKANELLLNALEEELKQSPYVFFSNFSGLKVSDLSELRAGVTKSGRRCIVVKNQLARVALKRLGRAGADEMLKGMSCVATASEEPQIISKLLVEFSKGREELFKVRGALLDGQVVSAEHVKILAKLPSQHELRAKVVGTIKAPINGFVLNLRGILQSLVLVLNAAQQKAAASQNG